MKISILRSDNCYNDYTLDNNFNTLFGALTYIKSNIDNTLTFGGGCRVSICGSCSVRVNSKEVLACEYKPKDGDIVEPLNYHKVLRDLKLDKKGYIIINPETGETSIPGVWAGGDIAPTGESTAINAMGAGKKAARAINEALKN